MTLELEFCKNCEDVVCLPDKVKITEFIFLRVPYCHQCKQVTCNKCLHLCHECWDENESESEYILYRPRHHHALCTNCNNALRKYTPIGCSNHKKELCGKHLERLEDEDRCYRQNKKCIQIPNCSDEYFYLLHIIRSVHYYQGVSEDDLKRVIVNAVEYLRDNGYIVKTTNSRTFKLDKPCTDITEVKHRYIIDMIVRSKSINGLSVDKMFVILDDALTLLCKQKIIFTTVDSFHFKFSK